MRRSKEGTIYWAVVAALVAAFGQELALGHVPLPTEWRWAVPIVVAGISVLNPYLKQKSR